MKKIVTLAVLLSQISGAFEYPQDSHFYYYDQLGSEEKLQLKGVPNTLGHGFNYQGQLEDNGSPANGVYDFSFGLYDAETDGNQIGVDVVKGSVSVSSGLFHIDDIDFGESSYTQQETWLRITVRETGDPGSETTLTPRQRVNVVPFAVEASKLAANGASDGDILQWDSFTESWEPSNPLGNVSHWNLVVDDLSYNNGFVGIGVVDPVVPLEVSRDSGFEVSRFNGGSRMFLMFRENNENRGYLGSYQNPSDPGINDEDFEIGTTFGSSGNMHIVTGDNDPRITATASGNVGINTVEPLADLMVEGTNDGDVFRVRVNENTKMYVDANGGASIGSFNTPPTDGLLVNGDIKQPISSNGMIKYMVSVLCNDDLSNVNRYYNGVNTAAITVREGEAGVGCTVTFPHTINNRFWQVSAVHSSNRLATCTYQAFNTNELYCTRTNANTGAEVPGEIMILVY